MLNGTKAWITNGGIADIHVVVASVDPELRPRPGQLRRPARHRGAVPGRKPEHGIRPRTPPRSCSTTSSSPAPAARRQGQVDEKPGPRRRGPGPSPLRTSASSRPWPPSRPPPRRGPRRRWRRPGRLQYSLEYAKDRVRRAGRSSWTSRSPHARQHVHARSTPPASSRGAPWALADARYVNAEVRSRGSSRPAPRCGSPSGPSRLSAATATREYRRALAPRRQSSTSSRAPSRSGTGHQPGHLRACASSSSRACNPSVLGVFTARACQPSP